MKTVDDARRAAIGKGLVAGFAGTAAMTVSSTIEAKLRGRALEHRAGARDREGARDRGVRGRPRAGALQRPLALGLRHRLGRRARAARATGLPAAAATAAHGAAVWGSAQVTLPGARRRAAGRSSGAREEVAIDVFHHTVYAIATGVAYELLGPAPDGPPRLGCRGRRHGPPLLFGGLSAIAFLRGPAGPSPSPERSSARASRSWRRRGSERRPERIFFHTRRSRLRSAASAGSARETRPAT